MEITEEPKDWWLVEVKSSLEAESRPAETHDGLIHKVPKSLLSSETEVFYHPQFISFGPYHFTMKRKVDDEMELLKSEVVRYVHHKIKNAFNASEKVTYLKKENGLTSVVESFKNKKKKIKKSYAREFEITDEVCAWMITRDACFVVQVLERFAVDEDEDKAKDKDKDRFGVTEDDDEEPRSKRRKAPKQYHPLLDKSVDQILSRKRYHPLLPEIVKDMLKMENQLPFWALEEIRPDIVEWFEKALKNLSLIEVENAGNKREYKGKHHILQLLHDYIVDRQQTPASSDHHSVGCLGKIETTLNAVPRILNIAGCARHQVKHWCSTLCSSNCCRCIYYYFSDCYAMGTCALCAKLCAFITWLFTLLVSVIILLVLSPVIFILFIIFAIAYPRPPKWKIREHVPTSEELKRLGVKFKKLEGGKLGISHIKFDERNSTLYLPQFKVDNKSAVILRNLIALEICSQEEQKPITRYVILMNDLINTSEDVGMLRGEDIITSKLGSDEEVAQLWNSMVTATEVPNYDPIDKAVLSIERYRNNSCKVLWAQFIMAYCSKPWLVVSLLAGSLLLLLTFNQVICLFVPCQIKKN